MRYRSTDLPWETINVLCKLLMNGLCSRVAHRQTKVCTKARRPSSLRRHLQVVSYTLNLQACVALWCEVDRSPENRTWRFSVIGGGGRDKSKLSCVHVSTYDYIYGIDRHNKQASNTQRNRASVNCIGLSRCCLFLMNDDW